MEIFKDFVRCFVVYSDIASDKLKVWKGRRKEGGEVRGMGAGGSQGMHCLY